MASYTFAVQHVGRPYAGVIPESAWRELSRHTSRRAAYRAVRLLREDMRRLCGVGAWNDHHRVVSLRTFKMRYRHLCYGWLDIAGRYRACESGRLGMAAEAVTETVWEADRPAPPMKTPAGWYDSGQCLECRERERAVEQTLA